MMYLSQVSKPRFLLISCQMYTGRCINPTLVSCIQSPYSNSPNWSVRISYSTSWEKLYIEQCFEMSSLLSTTFNSYIKHNISENEKKKGFTLTTHLLKSQRQQARSYQNKKKYKKLKHIFSPAL